MRKLRTAVVGLGWVALHRHLPVMEGSPQFEIAGVIDRSPGRAREIRSQRHYRHSAETADLTSVEWLKDVDVVTVATAPMSHYSIIRQALELGKHVITEKPFTMTPSEGEQLVRIAEARGLSLAIVHNFQFARSTKRLFAEMRSRKLGRIRAVNAVQLGNPRRRLPSWYEQLPLGLFYDESPHLLYLLRAVAGDVQLIRCITHASTAGLSTPARIDAFFESPEIRGPINLTCNFESPVSEWYLMVFGEDRLGMVDVFRDIYISLPNDGEHRAATVFRTSLVAVWQHMSQHLSRGIPHLTGRLFYGNEEVFSRFADAVNGSPERLAPISAQSALAVLRLQHAIVENQEWVSHPISVEVH